jgi:hypothetical protein
MVNTLFPINIQTQYYQPPPLINRPKVMSLSSRWKGIAAYGSSTAYPNRLIRRANPVLKIGVFSSGEGSQEKARLL